MYYHRHATFDTQRTLLNTPLAEDYGHPPITESKKRNPSSFPKKIDSNTIHHIGNWSSSSPILIILIPLHEFRVVVSACFFWLQKDDLRNPLRPSRSYLSQWKRTFLGFLKITSYFFPWLLLVKEQKKKQKGKSGDYDEVFSKQFLTFRDLWGFS